MKFIKRILKKIETKIEYIPGLILGIIIGISFSFLDIANNYAFPVFLAFIGYFMWWIQHTKQLKDQYYDEYLSLAAKHMVYRQKEVLLRVEYKKKEKAMLEIRKTLKQQKRSKKNTTFIMGGLGAMQEFIDDLEYEGRKVGIRYREIVKEFDNLIMERDKNFAELETKRLRIKQINSFNEEYLNKDKVIKDFDKKGGIWDMFTKKGDLEESDQRRVNKEIDKVKQTLIKHK